MNHLVNRVLLWKMLDSMSAYVFSIGGLVVLLFYVLE